MKKIVLASASPYRAELLKKIGLDFVVAPSHLDEQIFLDFSAAERALKLSEAKARAISHKYPNHLIIGSDQVAICNNQILEKPGNRQCAIQQLLAQSGNAVQFFTGLCVLDTLTNDSLTSVELCSVTFKQLSRRQIENYIDRDQPYDCAGSFKSEGLGIALLHKIEADDPSILIGLPLIKLIEFIKLFGVEIL